MYIPKNVKRLQWKKTTIGHYATFCQLIVKKKKNLKRVECKIWLEKIVFKTGSNNSNKFVIKAKADALQNGIKCKCV